GDGPRVYRRADVEQVLKIKHLLLVEGLTLAGARRKLEEETMPVAADAPVIDELIGQNARERLTSGKRGLQSILDLFAHGPNGDEFRLKAMPPAPPRSRAAAPTRTKVAKGRGGPAKRTAKRRH